MSGRAPLYTPRAHRDQPPTIFLTSSTSTNPPPFLTASNPDQNPLPAVSKDSKAALPAQVESSFAAAMSIQCRALRIVRTVLLDTLEECELVAVRAGFLDFYSELEQDLEDLPDDPDVREQMADCSEEIAAMTADINTVRSLFCSNK